MITVSISALLYQGFWNFPETAWRFIPYRQAAHQVYCVVLVLDDPPGGYDFLPGDATLFAFYFRDFVNVCMRTIMDSEIDLYNFYWRT